MSIDILEKSYWVIKDSILGVGKPESISDIKKLQDIGIVAFITLLEDSDMNQLYEQLGIDYLWLSTEDYRPPTLEAVESAFAFYMNNKERGAIAIHCKGGRGRTGTLIASLLIKMGKSKKDALELLYSSNQQIKLKEEQLAFLDTIS